MTVILDQSVDDDENRSPGFGAATMIIGITIVAMAFGRRRRQTGN